MQNKFSNCIYGSVHPHWILSLIFSMTMHVNKYRHFKRSGRANVPLEFKDNRTTALEYTAA